MHSHAGWPSTAPLRERIGVTMAGAYYELRVFAAMLLRVGALTKAQYDELVALMETPNDMTTGDVLAMLEQLPPPDDNQRDRLS